MEFEKELRQLINKHGVENRANTPDYVLARYIEECLFAFARAVAGRDRFYGFNPVENREA